MGIVMALAIERVFGNQQETMDRILECSAFGWYACVERIDTLHLLCSRSPSSGTSNVCLPGFRGRRQQPVHSRAGMTALWGGPFCIHT